MFWERSDPRVECFACSWEKFRNCRKLSQQQGAPLLVGPARRQLVSPSSGSVPSCTVCPSDPYHLVFTESRARLQTSPRRSLNRALVCFRPFLSDIPSTEAGMLGAMLVLYAVFCPKNPPKVELEPAASVPPCSCPAGLLWGRCSCWCRFKSASSLRLLPGLVDSAGTQASGCLASWERAELCLFPSFRPVKWH